MSVVCGYIFEIDVRPVSKNGTPRFLGKIGSELQGGPIIVLLVYVSTVYTAVCAHTTRVSRLVFVVPYSISATHHIIAVTPID